MTTQNFTVDYGLEFTNSNGNITGANNVETTTITFADGTVQETAYVVPAQLGYFTEIPPVDYNTPEGMASVVDDQNNAYMSTYWYNGDHNIGQITKFDSSGAKLWSKDIDFANPTNVNITSLTFYTLPNTTKILTAMGNYYNYNTGQDQGFAIVLNADTGETYSGGEFDVSFTESGIGVDLYDGVFDVQGGAPTFTGVGYTYGETTNYTLTPVAPSTTNKCYVTWADLQSSGVPIGSSLYFVEPNTNQDYLQAQGVLQYYTNAWVEGSIGTGVYFNLIVSYDQSNNYSLVRIGGSGGNIYGIPEGSLMRIMGSEMGGVDGVNDLTFNFSASTWGGNYDSFNGFTNIAGTSISNVYLPYSSGFDFSTIIGTPSPFVLRLNSQGFLSRLGGTQAFSISMGEGGSESFYGVANDGAGNAYACGYYDTNVGKEATVMSFDSAGALRWSVYIDPDANIGSTAYSIDVAPDGNVFVSAGNCYVTKLDPDTGAILWQTYITSYFNWNDDPYGLSTPESDYVIAGKNDNDSKIYVTRFSGTDGSVMWQKVIARTIGDLRLQRHNDAQYLGTSVDKVSIAATYYDPVPDYQAGLAIEIPSDGNCNGTYGVYTINDASVTWELQTTTAQSMSPSLLLGAVQSGPESPTITNSTLTFNTIPIGSASVTDIIYNGTSNVSIPNADGNVIVSVADSSMNWTFATDGKLYSKTDSELNFVVTDTGSGSQVRQTIKNGSDNTLSETYLGQYNFNINLDQQGAGYNWNFNSNYINTPGSPIIQAFDTPITIQSMYAGSNGVASLRSVSNANDPNVFTSIDATTTGANIVVWNGGSVGGTANTWTFSNTGNLTLPGNTFAVNYANGTPVSLGGGSSYSDSNVITLLSAFGSNTISTTGTITSGNVTGGNVLTGGLISATGNITGGNITTLGTFGAASLSASGNVNGGNILAAANVVFGANSGQLNFNTGAYISGNANSLGRDGSIVLSPYTGAGSTFPGVVIGGAGRLLSPGGSVHQIFNSADVTFQVAVKLITGTNATSTTSGALQVSGGIGATGNLYVAGNATTGNNAVVAGVTGTLLANSTASFFANVNSYTQITYQNKSTGADATADFILTADNGNDIVNYSDFGIINSGYDNATPTNSLGNIVYAADTYLYAQGNVANTSQSGGNLAIGTTTAGKNVKIFAGGVDSSYIVANISRTGISVTGNISISGNATVSGTASNLTRRAYGLVAADTYVTLDDLSANVSSSTGQLGLFTSGSWQGTGWTETFQGGGTPSVQQWVNLPLSSGFGMASGSMSGSQGYGCRCVISDQTPSAKMYEITVVKSGTSGSMWNISIERLV